MTYLSPHNRSTLTLRCLQLFDKVTPFCGKSNSRRDSPRLNKAFVESLLLFTCRCHFSQESLG